MNAYRLEQEEMIKGWIMEKETAGATLDELSGTVVVCGNELVRLVPGANGQLEVSAERFNEVVVLARRERFEDPRSCLVCGMEHEHAKAATECCAEVE